MDGYLIVNLTIKRESSKESQSDLAYDNSTAGGANMWKIEQAKQNVRWTMEYNIREYGLTGELVETDYFVGEYTEGRVFCYDLRIKK